MNLKLLSAWYAWKHDPSCNIFQNFPEGVVYMLGDPELSTPYTVLDFKNNCQFPVAVKLANYDYIVAAGITGIEEVTLVDAESQLLERYNCSNPGLTVRAKFEADYGEQTTVEISCFWRVIGVPTHYELNTDNFIYYVVTRYSENITQVGMSFLEYPIRETYNSYYHLTQCCKKCGKPQWHSFCEFYDSLAVPPPPGLKDQICGGWPVIEQNCKKSVWKNFDGFYDMPSISSSINSLDIPAVAGSAVHLCKDNCGLRDIRLDPTYRKYIISDQGISEAIKFTFPLLSGVLVDFLWATDVGTIGVNVSAAAAPDIPSSDSTELFTPLWTDYTGYGEIGGVQSADLLTVQWTDLEVPGGGRVTTQVTLESKGDWQIRTGFCDGNTTFLDRAVTGWQADSWWDKIEICEPCNIALDFSYHRQTKYVEQYVSKWLFYPSIVDDWSGNRGDAMIHASRVTYGNVGTRPAGELQYWVDGYPMAMAATIIYAGDLS